MNATLRDVRRDYSGEGLPGDLASFEPWAFLDRWIADALAAEESEPTAMTLSTVGLDGRPRSRVVLLKGAAPSGLVFFSHYDSPKGDELAATPAAAVNLWWPTLMRQVRAVGEVHRLSRQENEDYFHSRPRASQVGAWASHQSQPLGSREELEAAVASAEERFADGDEVPCPPGWGGYRIVVDEFEFWQGQASRLHDRVSCTLTTEGWSATRLQP
ncbi:pyridoxamine 5'-phosphate oxidase [Tessaracoccus sp. Z1128]